MASWSIADDLDSIPSGSAEKENLNFLAAFQCFGWQFKVAVNVSGGEQTFPQIMADFSLFVH